MDDDDDEVEEEEVHTIIIIPPDGGWGFIVIISSFICLYVIEGSCNTFGIFLEPLSKSFGTKMADTALVGSALTSISALVGPFVSACLNYYDVRCVCVSGCILAGFAYAISAVTTDYYILFAANGVLLGLGYGMLYIPALIMPSIYFLRYRALAVSISTCGSGIGSLTIPNGATAIIDRIGLVVLAAIASLAYSPVEPVEVKSKRLSQFTAMSSRVQFSYEKEGCSKCCRWRNKNFPTAKDIMLVETGDIQAISTDPFSGKKGSMSSDNVRGSLRGLSRGSFLSRVSMAYNQFYNCWYSFLSCLCSECLQSSQRPMYRQDIFFPGSIHHIQKYRESAHYARRRIEKKKLKRMRQEQLQEQREKRRLERLQLEQDKKHLMEERIRVMKERLRVQEEIDDLGPPTDMRDKRSATVRMAMLEKVRQLRIAEKKIAQEIKNIVEVLEIKETTTAPINKEELRRDFMKYNMSVTHVTTDRELYEPRKCSCSLPTIRALTTLLDCNVLRSVAFLLICFNAFFFSLGYYIPLMFIVERATDHNIPKDQAVMFLALIGGANTIGRLVSGAVSMIKHMNYALLIGVCCVIQGAITAFSGYFMQSWAQMSYVVLYGFLAAPMQALKSLVIVELFGIEHLSNLYGLQLVGSGLAALLGGTLGGYLRDTTQNYNITFLVAGGSIIFSAVLLFVVHPVRRWEVRKEIVDF